MNCDIIIPSCKNMEECQGMIDDITKTRVTEGKLIFTGLKASAAINRNNGLIQSCSEYIIMLDDDMTGFYWGWDIDMIRPLKTDENILMTSARLMGANGKPAYSMIENYDLNKPYHYSNKIPTACIAFKRNELRFDENFIGSGFEDDDYCRQMLDTYGHDKSFATINTCKLIHINEQKNQSGAFWEANLSYFKRKWAGKAGKPIALCKAWRGNEFVIPAIEALYSHCDKIIFVHTELSWCGEKGNDVKPVVEEWAKSNDNEGKIINLDFTTQNQEKQYLYGLEYITKNFNNEYVLFFDTDEVHTQEGIEEVLGYANLNPNHDAYTMRMYTYIKSPFYRIFPPEPLRPIVLYRLNSNSFCGVRGCGIANRGFSDARFHHFTYVRKDEKALFTKIENIYEAEKDAYGHVDLVKWKAEKWDMLPNARDFHTAEGFEKNWKGVQVVKIDDLPITIRDTDIVKAWEAK